MWSSVVFLAIAVVAVALLMLVAMVLSGKRAHIFDVEAYQTRWLKLENSLVKGQPLTYNMAVMQGDKLLDRALTEMGVPGKTMAERLKRMDGRLSKINQVWAAHKLRNRIAHETDFEVDYNEASQALAAFKQALKELGAI